MTEGKGEVKELPEGWIGTSFESLIVFLTDYQANGSFASLKENVRYYDNQNYAILVRLKDLRKNLEHSDSFVYTDEKGFSFLKKSSLTGGEILVANVGAGVGTTVVMPKPKQPATLAPNMFLVILPKEINKQYFFCYCQSLYFWRQIGMLAGGSGQPKINKKQYGSINIPLSPLNEQERIIEKIEELFSDIDQGVESLKTAQKQLKVYRQAVLKWAFEGKLTEEWRKRQSTLKTGGALLVQIKAERENRYQQQLAEWEKAVELWEAIGKVGKKPNKPQKPKELSPLGEKEIADILKLPEKWKWVQLGEFLDNIEAGKSFRCDERPPKNDEIGVAKVSAVTWGTYDELESKTCLEEDRIEEKFLIESGDFLFSRANTIELVGACVIAQKVSLRVMLSDKTLRFKFPKKINQKFILYFLRSRYGRNEIERLATGNQESMRNIGQERILGIRTPFPSFTEQEQIVEEIESRLSTCDQLEATIIENLQKAEALRQSILKQAFEGKLVPQDANDEPAEKLLERIQAEREVKQPKTSKQSKQLSLESL